MPRPVWKGAVTFGLVSVPVNLYPATRRQAELSFRLLHAKDKAPIEYKRVCTEEGVEVPWREIVKGYEYEKGQFVVLVNLMKALEESLKTGARKPPARVNGRAEGKRPARGKRMSSRKRAA